MGEWRTQPLVDVVALQRGYDLPTDVRIDGDVPVVGSAGISGAHNEARAQGPGLVVGRAGASIGKATFVAGGPYWPLNTALFATSFRGNCPRWVYHLFETLDLTGFNSGGAQPMLNRNYIKGLEVRVPPVAEQQAIAEVLGALDDKIAANERIEQASGALMVLLASSSARSVTIEELASHSKRSVKPEEFDEGVAHFSLPAFDAGASPEYVAGDSIKSNKVLLDAPSVLISKLNPRIPRVWDVSTLPDHMALASTEFVALQPTSVVTSELWAALCQPAVAVELAGKVAGTSGSHQRVKPAEVMSLEVPDPRALTGGARDLVASLGRRRDAAKGESRSLASARDELLPLLMSGKVRVKDAEKVVEEVL